MTRNNRVTFSSYSFGKYSANGYGVSPDHALFDKKGIFDLTNNNIDYLNKAHKVKKSKKAKKPHIRIEKMADRSIRRIRKSAFDDNPKGTYIENMLEGSRRVRSATRHHRYKRGSSSRS